MAKKFGKFLAFTAIVGAAAAGVCYYLNREESSDESGSDFAQDVDNFFENKRTRDYVCLNKVVSEENKEALKNAVEKATEEIKEKAEKVAEKVGLIREDSVETTDFAFEEFTEEANSETAEEPVEESSAEG